MREIKFRGKARGEWVHGSLIVCEDGHCVINCVDGLRHVSTDIGVVSETVGQFTGMYDADGSEIYEGDILGASKTTVIVDWGVDGWVADCFTLLEWLKLHDSRVIGNVHDSPELLEDSNGRL